MRILIGIGWLILLVAALFFSRQGGPWFGAMILPIAGASLFWGPVGGWVLAALSGLAVFLFQAAPGSSGWLVGEWISFGSIPLLLWGRKRQLEARCQKLQTDQGLLRYRLGRFQGERQGQKAAIREREEMIQSISELYGLSKKFLGTLDLDEVLQISEEMLRKEFPFLPDAKLQDYLQYVGSLVNQGKISVEVLAQALPVSHLDARMRDRWGILSGQFALGLQRVSLYQQVQESAIHDGLTGLLVRRYFLERLEEEVQRSGRRHSSLVFLMVDLDHFKEVNDRYGHLVGDVVLREVAHLIRRSVREIDLVGRFGGEEFSVVLPEADQSLGVQIADRIRQTVEQTVIPAYDEQVRVTVSIGVSLLPHNAPLVDSLIEQADRAMYRAKELGRNQTVTVDASA